MRILLLVLWLGAACQGYNGKPRLVDILNPHPNAHPNPHPVKKEFNNVMPTHYPHATPPRTHDPMEDELVRLEEAFLFPGSHYLINLVERYVEYGMNEEMTMHDIKDYFELPECDMKDITKRVVKVSKIMDDPESMALFTTRMMIKPILKERMKCPATILDMAVAKSLTRSKEQFLDKEDESLYTMFKNLVPLVDPMLEPYAEDIAIKGVHELHGYVFNETRQMLFGFGLRDVAFASHRLYENLVNYFRMPDMYPGTNPQDREYMFMDSVYSSLWEVMCPYSYDVVENHRKIVLRFKNEFEVIEREHICMGVADFLYRYVNMTMPGHMIDFENTVGLPLVCDEIKDTIDDIVKGYSEYENLLYSMNIRELEEILKEDLSPHEWNLLEEALTRMDFVNMPISGSSSNIVRIKH